MEKFEVSVKKSALKQLRSFPNSIQVKIQQAMVERLTKKPYMADGKHIKKLMEGFRLRVGDYRIFYYIDSKEVIVTSIVRRTSKTY